MKNTTEKNIFRIISLEKIFYFVQKYRMPVMIFSSGFYIAWMLTMYPRIHNDAFKMNSILVSLCAFSFGIRGGLILMLFMDVFLISYLSAFLGVPADSYLKDAVTGSVLCFFLTLFINGLTVMYRKISLLNNELKEMSLNDSLTGLRNRRYFKEVVSERADHFIKELSGSEIDKRDRDPNEQIMGICMIDIDYFKNINDTYGHDAGDCVLKEISSILKELVRFDDSVIRWGGEEFIIFLNRTKISHLSDFLKSLKNRISGHPFNVDGDSSVHISVSGGCINYPFDKVAPGKLTFDESVEIVDRLLYYAKKIGRNCLVRLKPIEQDLDCGELKELLSKAMMNDPEVNGDIMEII